MHKFELKFMNEGLKKPKMGNKNSSKSSSNLRGQKHGSMYGSIEKGAVVHFVNGQRSQQVQIGLKNLGLNNKELRKGIMILDDNMIGYENLIKLEAIIPTAEEQLQAEREAQQSHIMYFGIVERFFYSLYDMIELGLRIKAWKFSHEFKYKVEHLNEQLTTVEKSRILIKSHQGFKLLLGLILDFGNHMNANSIKGNQYGFQLNVLSLLPNIKTLDNLSFLMYLYDFLEKHNPNVLQVIDDFAILEQSQSS